MEFVIWLTAFCVAEKTDEKNPLEPNGDVNDPPGVFASSAVGVRIDGKLPNLPEPGPALARRVPDSCTVRGLVVLLFERSVPSDNGDFLGDGGSGSMGVGGVMMVNGVSSTPDCGELKVRSVRRGRAADCPVEPPSSFLSVW